MSVLIPVKPVGNGHAYPTWTKALSGSSLFLTNVAATDKCPKCGKMAWKPDLVIRVGKDPERAYKYYRYRHPLDGRTKRNKTCYVRVKE